MDTINLYVDQEELRRLDLYLSEELDEISRTYIQNLIKDGLVLVNGKVKKPKYLVKEGDTILVELPKPKKLEVIPENIPLDIVYEDEDIAVIDKSQDMVVHPAPGNYSGTLVNALMYSIDNLSSINGIIRPGIVHRLDKDPSGLLVVAKNDYSHRFLSEQFKDRTVKREYIAIVEGLFNDLEGTINAPIGRNPNDRKKMKVTDRNSKEAITRYKVLDRFSNHSLLELELKTGRTHQIRVHLSYINKPILGDSIYGSKKNQYNLQGQLLHARKLGFIHPRSKKYIEFKTEIPKRFNDIINKLK